MLFLTGCLSLLQVVLLPGLIICLLTGARLGLSTLLISFPASLFANYILFHLVSSFQIPMRAAWISILGLEFCILLIYFIINKKVMLKNLFEIDVKRFCEWKNSLILNKSSRAKFGIVLVLGCLNIGLLGFLLSPLLNLFTSTYSMWDDTLNWGRWAANWATSGSPGASVWWYPQLGPINRAISYVLMGSTEIHFFSKAAMPLFSVYTVLMFLDLELRFKNLVFLTAVPILCSLIILFGLQYHPSGLMDLPAMMLIFAAAYPLLLLDNKSTPGTCWRAVLFSALAGCAAIWTKQSGLMVFWGCSVGYFWVRKQISRNLSLVSGVVLFLCLIVAATSFYVPQYLKILSGGDQSNIGYLQTLTIRDPWFNSALLGTFTAYPFISSLVVISTLGCFFYGKFKWFSIPVALVFFFIWGSSLNYGIRNFYFAFPAIAIMGADALVGFFQSHSVAILKLGRLIRSQTGKMAYIRVWLFISTFAVLATILLWRIPDRILINRQKNANLMNHPGLPIHVILDVARLVDSEKKILTVFAPATTVPESEGKLVYYDKKFTDSPDGIFKTLGDQAYGFLVYEPGMVPDPVREKIQQGIDTGVIKVLVRNQNTHFLQYPPQFFNSKEPQK